MLCWVESSSLWIEINPDSHKHTNTQTDRYMLKINDRISSFNMLNYSDVGKVGLIIFDSRCDYVNSVSVEREVKQQKTTS